MSRWGDQDGGPPGLDRAGEPGRLGQLNVDRGLVEVGQGATGSSARLSFTEQQSQAFFDRPCGLDLLIRTTPAD